MRCRVFGEEVSQSGEQSRYGYVGREENDSGKTYFRARHYDKAKGRFLSEDPLFAFVDGTGFDYAANSPVKFKDPLGLSPIVAVAGFVLIVVAIALITLFVSSAVLKFIGHISGVPEFSDAGDSLLETAVDILEEFIVASIAFLMVIAFAMAGLPGFIVGALIAVIMWFLLTPMIADACKNIVGPTHSGKCEVFMRAVLLALFGKAAELDVIFQHPSI